MHTHTQTNERASLAANTRMKPSQRRFVKGFSQQLNTVAKVHQVKLQMPSQKVLAMPQQQQQKRILANKCVCICLLTIAL